MSTDSYDDNEINPHDCCGISGKVQRESDVEIHPDNLHDRASNRNPGPYPFFIGIAAALGVVVFYFGLLTLTSDWNNAKMQFEKYRWWIIAFSVGLGIQTTLFSSLRKQLHAYVDGKVQPGRIRRNFHRLHGSLLCSLFSAPLTGFGFTLPICSGSWYSRNNIASVPERIFEWKLTIIYRRPGIWKRLM